MHLRIPSKKASISNVDFPLQEPSADLEIIFPDIVVDLNDILCAGLVQLSVEMIYAHPHQFANQFD